MHSEKILGNLRTIPILICDADGTQLGTTSSPVKTDGSGVTQPIGNPSNLDVALSTRLKPADTLTGVTTVTSVTAITNALPTGTNSIGQVTANAGTNLNTSNLDVLLSTRLKPADTLTGVTTVTAVTSLTQMNGQAISMGTGLRAAGTQRVTIATDDIVPASQSGVWTVQPGNTANTTAWKVDGSAVIQPASQSGTWTMQPGNTANTTAWRIAGNDTAGTPTAGTVLAVQGIASMTKLLVTPDSVALPANQSINTSQINGVAPLMGAGNTGTGSLRVTVASDQATIAVTPLNTTNAGAAVKTADYDTGVGVDTVTMMGLAFPASGGAVAAPGDSTNGLKVQIIPALPTGANVIGALSANQSVNTAQINGVVPTMGNGISGTGVQRVTIASDSTGQVALAAGTATIGALSSNQSVNVAQINGVTTTMGNGISGTGVQRVTIASDSTGQVALAAGTATIGALTANQSVNVSQVGGVAVSTGLGVAGTGVLRVVTATDSSLSLGTSTGKTNVLKTGTLATVATTAGQVVLTYTVTAGKTLYVEAISMEASFTAISSTATILGTSSVETPSGTKVATARFVNPTTSNKGDRFVMAFGEPVVIAAGVVLRIVCTPSTATSITWIANFVAYEK